MRMREARPYGQRTVTASTASRHLRAALALAALVLFIQVPTALASSGSITNVHAVGSKGEATYTTNFDLCTGGYCGWFPHAWQYPAAQACAPEGSNFTYVGDFHSTSGSETATETFYPAYTGTIRICLYAYHDGNNYFIAEAIFTPSPSAPTPPPNPTTPGPGSISLGATCYREGDSVRLSGKGFTPRRTLDIDLSPGPSHTAFAGSGGSFATSFPAPAISILRPRDPEQERVQVSVEERASGSESAGRSASGSFLVTTLAVATSPSLPAYGNIPRRVSFRLSGFESGRLVFAHWRHGHSSRGNERVGRAHGPCGDLSTPRRTFRERIDESGHWTIQFDQHRSYSAQATPQTRLSFSIVSVPARR